MVIKCDTQLFSKTVKCKSLVMCPVGSGCWGREEQLLCLAELSDTRPSAVSDDWSPLVHGTLGLYILILRRKEGEVVTVVCDCQCRRGDRSSASSSGSPAMMVVPPQTSSWPRHSQTGLETGGRATRSVGCMSCTTSTTPYQLQGASKVWERLIRCNYTPWLGYRCTQNKHH